MQWSSLDRLEAASGDISFNDPTGDTLFVDPDACDGLDQGPARTPIYRRAATDGANVFPFLKDSRPIVVAGVVLIRSSVTEAGYAAAREALIDDTIAKLDELLTAAGALVWTAGSIDVYSVGGASFPGPFHKRFLIPLIAPDPAIT